ncbi:small ribosomal subunit protein uS7m [Lethenteron reissneri]|uniref:small ribosomal subunit protein uS7m n=1 Tax=Lethenteron reissneri TaxID=7753 RepID=UPI002AB70316|nr:small ribosomal subunit protein uS7m [Lethenteron reissneri]
MAASSLRPRVSALGRVALLLRRLPGPCPPVLMQVRGSQYNPHYLPPDPIGERSRLQQQQPPAELSAEERELDQLKAVRPIKAAPASLTSSVFYDDTVSKFINMLMKGGNKVLARSIMQETLELIKRKQLETYYKTPEPERDAIECNPYTIFHTAMENCKPVIGLVTVKKGGKNYQVPTPLKDNRRRFLAMKWLITECRENKARRSLMQQRLSVEVLRAFTNEGNVIKRKHDLHRMAEGNRAFAHYRWW